MKSATAQTPATEPDATALGPLRLRNILVPTDFSEASHAALIYAQKLAHGSSGAIHLLHVVEPAYRVPGDGIMHFPGDRPDPNLQLLPEAEKAVARLADMTARTGRVPVYGKVRIGSAYDQITQAAEELPADLIVISTHGYTGLKHALIGSVAEKVVRHAPCPVLVVREPKSPAGS